MQESKKKERAEIPSNINIKISRNKDATYIYSNLEMRKKIYQEFIQTTYFRMSSKKRIFL